MADFSQSQHFSVAEFLLAEFGASDNILLQAINPREIHVGIWILQIRVLQFLDFKEQQNSFLKVFSKDIYEEDSKIGNKTS